MSKDPVEVNPTQERQKLWYAAKPLVVCSLPQIQPRTEDGKLILKWVRRNGRCTLEMSADEELGLPYGRDRHLFYWLKTQSTLRKTTKISFEDGTSILKD